MGIRGKGLNPLDARAGHLNVLLYGISGNGKSTCTATAPGNVCYLLSEPQAKKAIQDKVRRDIAAGLREPGSLEIFEIEEKRDANGKIVRTKMEHLNQTLASLERDPEGFDSVVLDSLSDMQESHVDSIEEKNGKMRVQDWGRVIKDTEKLCRRLRDMKMHTFVITLADEDKDDESRVYYRPALKGRKLPHSLPKYFNLVTYIDKINRDGENIHIARMNAPSNRFTTKAPMALDKVEPTDIREWIAKMDAEEDKFGGEHVPSESEITETRPEPIDSGNEKINKRLQNPKTIELFEALAKFVDFDEETKIKTLTKYKSNEKLWDVLSRKLEEAEAKAKVDENKEG